MPVSEQMAQKPAVRPIDSDQTGAGPRRSLTISRDTGPASRRPLAWIERGLKLSRPAGVWSGRARKPLCDGHQRGERCRILGMLRSRYRSAEYCPKGEVRE